ncbi:MAG: hypothetical protein Q7R49_00520 [Candidatus Daviesbacteria bacterium]|nr:hypothetical protein [Candidatus Daviesbacteria bacterium]
MDQENKEGTKISVPKPMENRSLWNKLFGKKESPPKENPSACPDKLPNLKALPEERV